MVTACGLIFTCYGNSKQDVVDLTDGIVEFLLLISFTQLILVENLNSKGLN